MKQSWDERYNTLEYVYGREPNGFFSEELSKRTPGRLLLPGEGEGRNAVFAALSGWEVDAFDQSQVGRQKALDLAAETGVNITYKLSSLEDFSFVPDSYDAVALIYFHASPVQREYLHLKALESLRPGGIIILEGFHKEQLGRNTGGPGSLDMLFDEAMILSDFSKAEALYLEKNLLELNEGAFHQGEASVIRFSARKLT
jgi:2-polyprenyl-3-methyl-5-hydroxy-6-metoxy-1,4-benzoquinol methylase